MVAIPSQRAVDIEPLFEQPLRAVLLRLPESVRNAVIPKRYAMLIGYDETDVLYTTFKIREESMITLQVYSTLRTVFT